MDLKKIKTFNLIDYARQRYGINFAIKNGKGLALCPFHPSDKEPKLSMYQDKNKSWWFKCLHENRVGSITEFKMQLEKLSKEEAESQLSKELPGPIKRVTPGISESETKKKAGQKSARLQPAKEKKKFESNKKSAKDQIKGFKKLGYVRLYRAFRDDPLWKKKRKFSQWEAFEDLYFEARGIDSPGFEFNKRIIDLKRGQLITSQRALSKRWDWSRGSVENFLKKLEKRGTITNSPSNLGRSYSIITFLNYNELNPLLDNNDKCNMH